MVPAGVTPGPGRDQYEPDQDSRRPALAARLAAAGFLAADDEADVLVAAADQAGVGVEPLAARRLAGEPLAWIVGHTWFAGHRLVVTPGVYVPRPHTEVVAARALTHLGPRGVAIDACTGSGAVAATLQRARPGATVLATDLDPEAVACARANGVDARCGDLLAPVAADLAGRVDVVVAVVPYVPTPALAYLQRDTFRFESTLAYDGGPDGTDLLRRLAADASRLLRPGGHLVAELGGDQAARARAELAAQGYRSLTVIRDDEGDTRAIDARWG
jgi:release factor glutamine methyltransferase